ELLRRLRQRVEGAGLAAIRHDKLARAFGCGLEEDRRFYFEKSLLFHEDADGGGDFAAQPEIARHLGPAQIEVTMLQPDFFVHLAGDFRIVNRERENFSHVQYLERLRHHFDFAGDNFWIVGAGGTLPDFAGDADDAFAA